MEPNKKLIIRLDYRIISVGLAIIIIGMLAIWQPWQAEPTGTRKVTVTGQSTVKAEPDQYQFNPFYERDTTAEITALNEEITKGLKALGVSDKDFSSNAGRNGSVELYSPTPVVGKEVSTISYAITLKNKELVQKVQDYLLTTNPSGTITPYPSFSTEKQKELENQARDAAVTDARSRADKTASVLGAKLGRVQEIGEGQQGGSPIAYASDVAVQEKSASAVSLPVQPGQQEFTYSVKVTFLLK